MRILKIILITLVVCLVSVSSLNCASESNSTAVPESQVVTVQRGDLTIDITAVGNLALSLKEDLAFEISGTVEEVLVEEGDAVEEGQILAKLDTSEWEDELTTKERDRLQAEINLKNAEIALEDAEALYVWPEEIFSAREKVRASELEVEEAQAILRGEKLVYDRKAGVYRYQEARTAWDIKVWTQKLSDAEEKLRTDQVRLDKLLAESTAEAKVANAEEKLRTAQVRLDKLLDESAADAEADTGEIALQRLKVELAQEQLEDTQKALEGVAIKRLQVELAQGRLEDAQKALDNAKSKSPVITAPFAGFITSVNVEGGDEVLTGTVAVQLADPNKFEADILVSEMDIFQVKLGGNATVQVDSMPVLNLPAEVTHISPTATIQSGVVNYKVKVEIQSLEAVMQERQEARQGATQDISAGELPERLQQAIEEGSITQEQAEEMMKQQSGKQQGQAPTILPENFQLREGLTVTVSILVEERNDVLLVPNGAITSQRGQAYVQVISPDGTIEERPIKTGISNWQFTEVTDGLSEGEQVVVPQGTATTTTTPQQERPPGMRIPVVPRIR